ncbi:MAG: DNA polymerase III subunit alpha [Gammaproteobacteria bacterium]|nr:DNA polymerase III subunit alpha [Gammaproteobacteria bacterium]
MSEAQFVHLHLHTEYSLVDSVLRIKPMVGALSAHSAAAALTDANNMMAGVKFYKACLGAGLKPILGVDLTVREADGELNRVVILSRTTEGYVRLCELITRAYTDGQSQGVVAVNREWLTPQSTAGMIALSAAAAGDVGKQLLRGDLDAAASLVEGWKQLFDGHYYLEIQRCGRPEDEPHLRAAVLLSERTATPLVATNDVRFIKADDFDAHETRVCINQGRVIADNSRPKIYSDEQYLRSPEEMVALFADLPDAISNTVAIAKMCNVTLTLGQPVLPAFPVPEGMTEDDFIRTESHKGLQNRFEQMDPPPDEATKQLYIERLDRELGVIIQMGFPGYFLIVADFIQWAKDHDIPVGPGRGSGAGSLVAYALLITDLDPIPYDLLFERFLNPERVSMPDFDIDFCMDQRDQVINYVAERYGREKVSQIITYGTMAAKAVVRDVGRVMGHGYGFVDSISKLIPFEVGMTLTKALEEAPDLKARYDNEEEVTELINMALKLEGVARNVGKHAGGVVIAPSALTDFCPMYLEEGAQGAVTQFDKDDAEAVGLVKFDFLGLRTLTIIDNALKIMRARGSEIDISAIDMDDKAAFDILQTAQTSAVFQLESRGMKELIKRLQPDCFEDIVALVALFRPGPLQSGMVDDFVDRKHGRQEVTYPHPDLEPVLKPTYGVILYQEQVMQIAQVLAKYSLGGADILRRAMGKKKPEEMDKQRQIFTEGAKGNGVDEALATYIFDLMEKFAGYGFNKSHSAAYALLSYQTAWLKAHFPAPFMCSVLSADKDNTVKVVAQIEECQSMGMAVLPPCINQSEIDFSVQDDRTLRYGLGAIKGVGEAALLGILESRKADGPFKSVTDLLKRIGHGKLNKRIMESLIHAGAFDCFGPNRYSLYCDIENALKRADRHHRDQAAGQNDLFGLFDAGPSDEPAEVVPDKGEYPVGKKLSLERQSVGLYLTGHPIDPYRKELERITTGRLQRLCEMAAPAEGKEKFRKRDVEVTAAGIVIGYRTKPVNDGKIGIITLDDGGGRVEVVLNNDLNEQFGPSIEVEMLMILKGGIRYDDFSGMHQIRAKEMVDLSAARAMRGAAIELTIDCLSHNGQLPVPMIESLTQASADVGLPIKLKVLCEKGEGAVWLPGTRRFDVSNQNLEFFRDQPWVKAVSVLYA